VRWNSSLHLLHAMRLQQCTQTAEFAPPGADFMINGPIDREIPSGRPLAGPSFVWYQGRAAGRLAGMQPTEAELIINLKTARRSVWKEYSEAARLADEP